MTVIFTKYVAVSKIITCDEVIHVQLLFFFLCTDWCSLVCSFAIRYKDIEPRKLFLDS